MRVFYINQFGEDEPIFGESTLVPIDVDYVQVNGQLRNKAFVWPATPENLQLYKAHLEEMKVWKSLQPNMFAVLNKMTRRIN